MTVAFRLTAWRWKDSAMSGQGAEMYPGRWNRAGERVVYLAGHISLAAFELFVHVERTEARQEWALIRVGIPGSVPMSEVRPGSLPRNWDRIPPGAATRRIGSAWLRRSRTPLLRVPSAVVPGESVLLFNPAHPLAARVLTSRPERFELDERLGKL